MALMAYLENAANLTLTSYVNGFRGALYADAPNYARRYPTVKGDPIGILVATGTLIPLQALGGTGIDIATSPTLYAAYIAPKVMTMATGAALYAALNNKITCPQASSICNGSSSGVAGQDCRQLLSNGVTMSGIYWINPQGTAFQDYCDMASSGGGWTLALRMTNNNILGSTTGSGYWTGAATLNTSDLNPSSNTNGVFASVAGVRGTDIRACGSSISSCIVLTGVMGSTTLGSFMQMSPSTTPLITRSVIVSMLPPDDTYEPSCNQG